VRRRRRQRRWHADLGAGSPNTAPGGAETVFYGSSGALNTAADLNVFAETGGEGFGDFSSL
jgi:hypothetical protein